MYKSKKIGEILIKEGLITQQQLNEAIQKQRQSGERLGEVLLRFKIVSEEDVAQALSKQLGIKFVSLAEGTLTPETDKKLEDIIPAELSHERNILPIKIENSSLVVAFVDPTDVLQIDNLKRLTKLPVEPVVTTLKDLNIARETFYGEKNLLKEAILESYGGVEGDQDEGPTEEEISLDKLVAKAEEAPVVKLVDLILGQAIEDKASDIHIEPYKDSLVIRYRIDGVLHEIPPPSQRLSLPLISRIKILSKLDIAEKRLPQDGSFSVKLKDRAVDLRVSTVPTVYGEKVVMRILDKGSVPLRLDDLGFTKKQLEDIRRAIFSPYGLVFVTGPTGSGKTTTLYAGLSELKSPHKNLLTIEDPVEYRLEGINQVQIKPHIGLTFAAGLRSFLRQDPDIIMVGEVRDLETAEICVKAALTGHLVLSTLHTNDAAGAIDRLINIGVEPFLVVSSLLIIIAQRLVRKLCPDCKEAYQPPQEIADKLDLVGSTVYKAKGCNACKKTGYRGRLVIGETLVLTDQVRELISKGANSMQIKEAAVKGGMVTLRDAGIVKVKEGVTSLEEVLSVTLGEEK